MLNPLKSEQDLNKLVSQVSEEFSGMVAEANQRLHFSGLVDAPVVRLDPQRVVQVLRNLVGNAVKFSPNGGVINVNVTRKSDSLLVTVKDSGVGIPEGELDSIFDRFVQSSKTKTAAGGTGLGLSICRQIIKAHEGCIWAKNNPDGGAIFQFDVPLAFMEGGAHEPKD